MNADRKKLYRKDIDSKGNTWTQPAKERAKSGIQEAFRHALAPKTSQVATLGAFLSGLGLGSGF
jgi:hypothetical protein